MQPPDPIPDLVAEDEVVILKMHNALARLLLPQGEVGEPVKLTLVRKGDIVRVTLKRTLARRYPLGTEHPTP